MITEDARACILVTGIAGGLAQEVARKLRIAGHEVIGVDYRPLPVLAKDLEGMTVFRASYNKTAIEDVFRGRKIKAVLHLGREGNLSKRMGMRFDLNVLGSQKIMNLCVDHGVKVLVVLSTFHIYGAHPHNHIPISEDDPIQAGYDFPEIADAIQLDSMASTWVYKHPEVRTVVLRPTNVVGPTIHNSISTFLRMKRVPYLAGFNPMVQFIHEEDLATAVVRAMDGNARGVFNVGGPAVLPWRVALELADARVFPVPSSLASFYIRTFSAFPEYLINFYKYPCVIGDDAFRKAFDWAPHVPIDETLASTVADARRRQRPEEPRA